MAKGDDSRARNQISYQGNLAQNNLNNLRTDTLIPQNQQLWNNFQNANEMGMRDYGNIMQGFQAPMAGYGEFAKTGGFSPTDLGNIRAQSIAPIRGMYAGANREVDRSRALQGGYSPGYGVLKSRLAREGSTALSDASTNVEGMIAQMVQQGKLAGLGGQADVGSRMSSLFGTAPGYANMAGNQALTSTQQRLAGEGLQGELSRGVADEQIAAGKLPGKTQSTLSNIGGILDVAGKVGGILDVATRPGSTIYPWLRSVPI